MSYAGEVLDQHTTVWSHYYRLRADGLREHGKRLADELTARGVNCSIGMLDYDPDLLLVRVAETSHSTRRVVARHSLFSSWLEAETNHSSDLDWVLKILQETWRRLGLPEPAVENRSFDLLRNG